MKKYFQCILDLFSKTKINKPRSHLDEYLKLAKEINPYAFKNIHSSDLSIFTLNVTEKQIKKFRAFLDEASFCIETATSISKNKFQKESNIISISDFFITADGYYVDDAVNEVILLRESLIRFLSVFISESLNPNIRTENTYNLSVLSFFLKNVIDITITFSKVM